MANGKIKADTLEHSTAGALDTQYVVNGSSKFWIALNGSGTPTAFDSLNVGSITDVGTGNYRFNFGSNFSVAKGYWTTGCAAYEDDHDGAWVKHCMPMQDDDVLTSSLEISVTYTSSSSTGDFDYTYVNMAGLGDLA